MQDSTKMSHPYMLNFCVGLAGHDMGYCMQMQIQTPITSKNFRHTPNLGICEIPSYHASVFFLSMLYKIAALARETGPFEKKVELLTKFGKKYSCSKNLFVQKIDRCVRLTLKNGFVKEWEPNYGLKRQEFFDWRISILGQIFDCVKTVWISRFSLGLILAL